MSVERWAVCDACGNRERHHEEAFSIYPDAPRGWVAVSFIERGDGGDHAIVCSRGCAIAFADRLAKRWGVTAEQLEAAEVADAAGSTGVTGVTDGPFVTGATGST